MKTGKGVFCLSPSLYQLEEKPTAGTPQKYSPEKIEQNYTYEYGTFETESGKTINVVKVFEDSNEVWLTSQVPFGVVKLISDGKLRTELVDFGSGAVPEITQEEKYLSRD